MLCLALGSLVASYRHEDYRKSIEYSFALVAPGLKTGHLYLMLLPMLTLSILISVFVLRKLKYSLFKASKQEGPAVS